MPRILTETQAQANFLEILNNINDGEEILIRRNDAQLFRLVPCEALVRIKDNKNQDDTWEQKIAAIQKHRKEAVIGPPMTTEEIIAARDEGRK